MARVVDPSGLSNCSVAACEATALPELITDCRYNGAPRQDDFAIHHLPDGPIAKTRTAKPEQG